MDEYISREEAIDKMRSLKSRFRAKNDWDSGYDTAIAEAFEHIKRVPVADVQPVKRGFWKALMMSEETGWDLSLTGGHDTVCEYVCSVCGKPNIVDEFGDSYLPNFCPNCGARMNLKDGDEE